MNRIKYRLSLDMFEVSTQTTIKAKKGDTACSIIITLTENGKIYHIADGCSAKISGKKSDGNYIFNGETCRIENNTIIYDFTEQTVAFEGVVECEVILSKDNQQLTTPRFSLIVDATIYNADAIISTPEADVLKILIDEANDVIEEVETKLENGDFVGEQGIPGEKGDDGVSVTHSWDGTVLNVTSASGTTSANLKGEKGDKGDMGEVSLSYANKTFANALKGSASGTSISITDVSPIEHNVDVSVESKNLYPGITSAAYLSANQSVAFEISQDGGIKLEGTATGGRVSIKLNVIDLPNGTYKASTTLEGTYSFIGLTDGSYAQGNQSFTVTDTNKVTYCQIRINEGNTVSGVCYFQIEKGTVATEYTPYDVSKVALGVSGINLYDDTAKEVGKNFGVSTNYPNIVDNANTNLSDYIKVLPNTTLTLNYGLMWAFYDKDKNYIAENSSGVKSATIKRIITVPENAYYMRFSYHTNANEGNANYSDGSDVMAVLGVDLPTVYQPFTKPLETYSVNADGTVEGVTSIYPIMSLITDTSGVTISVEYNRDINKCEFGGTPNLDNYYTKSEVDSLVGDIETALDNIIAMQNSYIGGAE